MDIIGNKQAPVDQTTGDKWQLHYQRLRASACLVLLKILAKNIDGYPYVNAKNKGLESVPKPLL
jgi:hypothetical protein